MKSAITPVHAVREEDHIFVLGRKNGPNFPELLEILRCEQLGDDPVRRDAYVSDEEFVPQRGDTCVLDAVDIQLVHGGDGGTLAEGVNMESVHAGRKPEVGQRSEADAPVGTGFNDSVVEPAEILLRDPIEFDAPPRTHEGQADEALSFFTRTFGNADQQVHTPVDLDRAGIEAADDLNIVARGRHILGRQH